jgi:2'-hydroxyisoflavone reductase
MKVLVLGGTLFLSRAVAADAVARGHDVTCAARGTSGSVPDGARLAHLDRAHPDWSALEGGWDAVVDVARDPAWVEDALAHLAHRAAHWTFVSTISVYADHSVHHGTPADSALLEPRPDEYGAAKVACEDLVRARTSESLVVRPGLIVGPGDPSGRFTYWPERLAEGGEVLAPADPDQPVQVVDVRDLAAFVVTGLEQRLTGTYDATGRATTIRDALAEVTAAVGGETTLVWPTAEDLEAREVVPWSGARSLPLWLPAELAGMLDRDVEATYAVGLWTRPLGDTARDTLAWLRADPDATRTGLTRSEEQEVLAWMRGR